MRYRIHDFDTGDTWYTDDEALAFRLSFDTDRYDVEENKYFTEGEK